MGYAYEIVCPTHEQQKETLWSFLEEILWAGIPLAVGVYFIELKELNQTLIFTLRESKEGEQNMSSVLGSHWPWT